MKKLAATLLTAAMCVGTLAGCGNKTEKSSPNMDENLKTAIQTALINIGNTDEGKEVIAIYSHNGYQPAESSDYDKEREAQKLIQELGAAN